LGRCTQSGIRIRPPEVEREFDLGLIADETRRSYKSYKRRFIVAWHESIPSSLPLDPIEPLLDVSRAAYLLGISVKTLRDWIHARRIEYVKVGARVMIRPETIRQFVTSNTRRAAIG
jgi:excisionase family DNA binding protein